MRMSFLGAAQEVTGSCYLLKAADFSCLVDCGMFQGGREAKRKNREALDFDLNSIDFVLVSHAHIDHSGLLPRLVALGYGGPIYTTRATCDLLTVMLPDSAYIQEKEVERENRKRHQSHKGREAAPLYTVAEAQESLNQLKPLDYAEFFKPHPKARCRFQDAGHILGSAIIELWVTEGSVERKLVFSGDLGQPDRPVVRDPFLIENADILLMESTYGNRLHKSMDTTEDELVSAINDTIDHKGGNVIIPAFAVGRTQEILYVLSDLMRRERISREIHIYVDSPMATRASELTLKHYELTDECAQEQLEWHEERGNKQNIRFTGSVEESIMLNNIRGGAIIISASGMCDAGRIKHHLQHNLSRHECSILISGFQAQGTLGRRLVDGARKVRLFGQDVPVRAQIYTIGGLSAHADQKALLAWLHAFKQPPARTFVVHGEASTALSFADLIRTRFSWQVEVPERGLSVDI